MLAYSRERNIKRAAVVGGGLLGLEAGKALLDLDTVEQAIIVERNQWVLSRQLDGEGGRMVLEKVKALGVEVLLQARVRNLIVEKEEGEKERLTGIMLEGQGSEEDKPYDLDMIVLLSESSLEMSWVHHRASLSPLEVDSPLMNAS
jgi:nitrite reductase (NAD(P)H)